MGFNRIVLLLLYFFLFQGIIYAQNYPPYKITVNDNSKGYYFLAPIKTGKNINSNLGMMILNKSGEVIFFKPLKSEDAILDFKIQPNGLISYFNKDQYYLMDSTFRIVDSVKCLNGISTDVHDFQVLKNGNYLLMGIEYIRMDLGQYKFFNRNGSPGSINANVLCGVIQEMDKNKKIVFEWHAFDHFAFDDVDPFYLNSPDGVDWNHFNGIEQDTDGNILLSQRHFNEITKINHSDGSIIWRWGGKKNMFQNINDSAGFLGQHDIRRIENGNMTMLDNGRAGKVIHPVSAKEYSIDEKKHTAILVWSYVRDTATVSQGTGNVQRLKNGNTLIDYGLLSKNRVIFSVVDPAGNKTFELWFIDSLISYRAFNYEHLPWQLKTPIITCQKDTLGNFFLNAGPGYSGYKWSDGDTTELAKISKADTLSVFVPYGYGGYIRSEPFVVSSHTDPCGLTGIKKDAFNYDYQLFPNPVIDFLKIKYREVPGKNIDCNIYTVSGEKIYSFIFESVSGTNYLQVNNLRAGIYILSLDGIRHLFIKE
jgi:hypothetical protein